MANTITETVFIDGSRNLVTQVHIAPDGSTNETNTVILDMENYSPLVNSTVPKAISIQKVCSHTGPGVAGYLMWEPSGQIIHQFPTNEGYTEQYTTYGPMVSPAGWDGRLYITTLGQDDTLAYVEFVIHIKKRRKTTNIGPFPWQSGKSGDHHVSPGGYIVTGAQPVGPSRTHMQEEEDKLK